jgi:hypothetical protein
VASRRRQHRLHLRGVLTVVSDILAHWVPHKMPDKVPNDTVVLYQYFS